MLGGKPVLVTAPLVEIRPIYKQDASATVGTLRLPCHDYACCQRGPIEEVRPEADDCFYQVELEDLESDRALCLHPEQRTIRQYYCHTPTSALHRGDHVLHPC